MNRRGFLAGILAAGVAPAIARSGVLMPVRPLVLYAEASAGQVLMWSGVDWAWAWPAQESERSIYVGKKWSDEELVRWMNEGRKAIVYNRIGKP